MIKKQKVGEEGKVDDSNDRSRRMKSNLCIALSWHGALSEGKSDGLRQTFEGQNCLHADTFNNHTQDENE